nr:spore germination protein [Cohnella zeiphila]
MEALCQSLDCMADAEVQECPLPNGRSLTIVYVITLIDSERLNEAVLEPLSTIGSEREDTNGQEPGSWVRSVSVTLSPFTLQSEANGRLMQGSVLIYDGETGIWRSCKLENPLGRAIESSETETILLGPKDSFSEQIDENMTLIRRRLPVMKLKAEKFLVGTLSRTTVVLMYLEGITNPDLVNVAKAKLSKIDYDMFLDSSHVAAFMEDHNASLFPQFMQSDRPDSCVNSLNMGKLVILVDNTPFALIAPITFFNLFQSPEDYINRWIVASSLRCLRYFSYFLSFTLIPLYVALCTYHYQMIPLQILYVLLESRSRLPLSPFWEAMAMLMTLEIIKEASLRMPSKTSQTLGVIGGIVIGQASVEAGFASKVLIVLAGISAIASFLSPNYVLSKSSLIVHMTFLMLASWLGVPGMVLGMVALLAHLNGLTSLNRPYLAPVAPFLGKDWIDLFIRGPLKAMRQRPSYLLPLYKWRYSQRRKPS